MAGEWIKMRTDLHTDPAVMRMAVVLNVSTFQIVGWLHAVWVWADTHADRHGHVTLVSRSCLDSITQREGFGEALESVGWLKSEPGEGGGITFPRFDRHMGEGAKARALAAKRKKNQRARDAESGHALVPKVSRSVRDKSVTREEKRREEKKEEDKTPLPPAKPGGGEAAPPTVQLHRPTEAPPGAEPGYDPAADLADAAAEPVEPWGELVREWVAASLPGFDAPGGIQRTRNRVGFWQTRLRDPTWRAAWREAVRRAGRSRACRGDDPNFMTHGLRLDTFLKEEDMLVRIIEGQFDDGKSAAGGKPDKRQAELDAAFAEDAERRRAG